MSAGLNLIDLIDTPSMASVRPYNAHLCVTSDFPDKGLYRGDYVYDMDLVPKPGVKLQPGDMLSRDLALQQVGVSDPRGKAQLYGLFTPDDGFIRAYVSGPDHFLAKKVAEKRVEIFRLLKNLCGKRQSIGAHELKENQYSTPSSAQADQLLSLNLAPGDAINIIEDKWALVTEISREQLRLLFNAEEGNTKIATYSLDQLLKMSEYRVDVRRASVSLVSK